MLQETVFHKILRKELPATVLYSTSTVLGFADIHPKAPTHVLFIPVQENDGIESIQHVTDTTAHVPGMLIAAAKEFAEQKGIDGYKLLFNVGEKGGQEVPYIHLHFLSNQQLS